MLKNYRLIALVFVFAASGFGAIAQTDETNTYKDVLLDDKPAKLNLVTGEITYINGEIAKSRTARKIKDSLLATRTEIKTNLIKDMSLEDSETTQNVAITDSVESKNQKFEESSVVYKPLDSEDTDIHFEENNQEDNIKVKATTTLLSGQTTHKTDNLAESNSSNFHMVKKGETLYELSKRYNTSLGQLMTANDLETTLIREGETLRVRSFETSDTLSETVWIVSKGDTLYNIAKRNNTTVEDIKDLNELSNNLIKVGQKLQVNQNSTLSKK